MESHAWALTNEMKGKMAYDFPEWFTPPLFSSNWFRERGEKKYGRVLSGDGRDQAVITKQAEQAAHNCNPRQANVGVWSSSVFQERSRA